MPELDNIAPEVPAVNQDAELIGKLFEYADEKHNPARKDYNKQLVECYQFTELNQWESVDMRLLALAGIPTISVDRINRNLDVIGGIRENTANRKKIVKREMGDERIADILDSTADYVAYQGGFEEVADQSFDSMLKTGIGIRKVGFDPTQGEGEIFAENVNVEDCGWSKCKSKELEDVRWIWHRQIMDWEDAMMIEPSKAGILKGIRAKLTTEWDKVKGSNTKGVFARDYENLIATHTEGAYTYPDQVEIWEFWVKKRTPFRKVGSIQFKESELGAIPIPNVRQEAPEYQAQPNEQDLGVSILEQWERFIVASSGGKANATLLKQEISEFNFHPFVGECALRKKSGAPFGFVEMVLPMQKRINLAWAQKAAWNNKAIKSPIIAQEGSIDIESATQQSQAGAIFFYKQGYPVPIINQVPQVNMQAIEEGNVARMDMDFAASASEPVLQGKAGDTKSGIMLSQQQSAAITPLTKWTKAEKLSELLFWRKVLQIMLKKFPSQRIARIIGEQKFMELVIGELDPMTGKPTQPPIQLNPDGTLPLESAHYDVIIQDSALSDFNKQQTFNGVMALQQLDPMGMFEDEFLIKSAPIKDVDAALASNKAKKNDIIQQLQQIIQVQKIQIDTLAKNQATEDKPPKSNGQHANAQKGKSAPQTRQNMLGGTSPMSPIGMGMQ